MNGALVICIGNTLRGDDGAAHEVARRLAGRLPSSARMIKADHLDLSMADEAAEARVVVLVDAERRVEPAVRVDPVEASPAGEFGHSLEPGHLLDIAWSLYATRPRMTLVTVAAPEMEHGEGLSRTASDAARQAVDVVLDLLGA